MGIAIDREVVVAVRPRTDGRVVTRSAELAGIVDIAADGRDLPSAVLPAWGRAVAGVVAMLAEHGRDPVGADLDVSSTVPLGAGLSSSAAFEVAVALALGDVAGLALPMRELAAVAQRAEHVAMGVPCGIQDQLTSLAGVAGQAVRIDCRTLDVEPRPIPPEVGVVVVNSGVARTLEGSPWLARRADSFTVAEQLGLRVLRDARPDQVVDGPRGRHVVSEIARASAFADARRAMSMRSVRSSSHPMRLHATTWRCPSPSSMRSSRNWCARVRGGASRAAASAVASSRSYRSSGHRTSRQRRGRLLRAHRRDPTAWVVTRPRAQGR